MTSGIPNQVLDVQEQNKNFSEGKLADSLPYHAESSSIEMLIGNDYYFELLEPKKMDMSGGLFLFHSCVVSIAC